VRTLERECLSYCSSLSSVIFEQGSRLKEIGKEAFLGCRSLQSVQIPGTIEKLEFWDTVPSRKLIFESGASVQRLVNTSQAQLKGGWSILLPRADKDLPFPGFRTVDIHGVKDFVRLVQDASGSERQRGRIASK
jgi:hypothetical protein